MRSKRLIHLVRLSHHQAEIFFSYTKSKSLTIVYDRVPSSKISYIFRKGSYTSREWSKLHPGSYTFSHDRLFDFPWSYAWPPNSFDWFAFILISFRDLYIIEPFNAIYVYILGDMTANRIIIFCVSYSKYIVCD